LESNQFSTWHGMDRAEIDWHPTIDEDRCVGCGLCVVTCGEKRNVFGYDEEKRRAVVMFPNNCMVGCINCMVGCLWNAISFPDTETVKSMTRDLPEEALAKELAQKLKRNPELAVQ
jgi:Fe-S-cluster-containing dehydrogenase component